MWDRYIAPLLLIDRMGELRGKTRLQKLMCIIKSKANRKIELEYEYEIYLHGPFSRDLARQINYLIDIGLINEDYYITPMGNIQFKYELTRLGKKFLRDLKRNKLLSLKLVKLIDKVIEQYGYMPLPSLIEEAYLAFEESDFNF